MPRRLEYVLGMLRVVVALPFLLLLVLFVLSNQETVRLGLWPTDLGWDVPLSIAILTASAVFFLLGALVVWFGALGWRRRARRAEQRVRVLEAECARAEAQADAVPHPRALTGPASSEASLR